MNETPLAQALVICDTIIEEARTSKKTLVGTFNGIVSKSFPMQHGKMCVYAALTNGRGTVGIVLRCYNVDTGDENLKVEGQVKFEDPNNIVEMVIHLARVPFKVPGLYAFELLSDGTHLIEKRFNVLQMSNSPNPGAKS